MVEDPIVYFIHMPKTGGSTMTHILYKQFAMSEIVSYFYYDVSLQRKLEDLNLNDIKLIYGHYFFGLHEQIKRPFSYFTIIRHPVDRVISLYYYLRSIDGELYDKYRKMTLDEFVKGRFEANIQTGLLSGNVEQPSVLKAVRNLLNYFDVVGTTDQFNETLYFIGKQYGWTDLRYKRVNVTKSRAKPEEVSEKTIQLIKTIHNKDLLLYEFATRLINKRLSRLDQFEEAELNDFKQAQTDFELE